MPYSYAARILKKMERLSKRARCPVCGRVGSGPYKRRVKGCFYLYFSHPYKTSEGKWKIKWHYTGKVV